MAGKALAVPIDAQPHVGNCGIVSAAIAAGVPVKVAETMYRKRFNPPKNWKGRTCFEEIAEMLAKDFHKKVRPVHTNAKTLQKFVERYAFNGATYIVRTTLHSQIVRGHFVADQGGCEHISEFWGKRKRVTHVYIIED